ncbi:MAG: 50S ribosomal protein L21 [Pirellulales bacterium]
MYAIIADSGRQYKVVEGQELNVDLRSDLDAGAELKFDSVLAIGGGEGGLQLGAPTLSGAAVIAEVIGVKQGPKLVVRKFRRRKTLRRKTGHRQMYTRVKISKIEA